MRRVAVLAVLIALVFLCPACTKEDGHSGSGKKETPAPSFTLSDSDGKKISLADFRGKVVLIEFFTTWCGPCQISAPQIQEVFEQYNNKGFVALAISLDKGSGAGGAVKSFIKEHGITYPVLFDDDEVSRNYEVFSIPTSFVLDKEGRIRNKHMGLIPDMSRVLSEEIDALLK